MICPYPYCGLGNWRTTDTLHVVHECTACNGVRTLTKFAGISTMVIMWRRISVIHDIRVFWRHRSSALFSLSHAFKPVFELHGKASACTPSCVNSKRTFEFKQIWAMASKRQCSSTQLARCAFVKFVCAISASWLLIKWVHLQRLCKFTPTDTLSSCHTWNLCACV